MDFDLKRVVGALIFASGRSLKISEIRRCIRDVCADQGGGGKDRTASEKDIREAIETLQAEMEGLDAGFRLAEVAGGFRFETDARCGKWLKQLLRHGGAQRLSQPSLETLAIIAYRQPISRAEMERIRGVNVDHVVRNLLEMQLVRIVGRSELPGRPFLYGTTQRFLQHFGLKSLKELEEMQPMLKSGALPGQMAKAEVTEDVGESD